MVGLGYAHPHFLTLKKNPNSGLIWSADPKIPPPFTEIFFLSEIKAAYAVGEGLARAARLPPHPQNVSPLPRTIYRSLGNYTLAYKSQGIL